MPNKLRIHKEKVEHFERTRKFWLRISLFVVISVNGIIWEWDHVQSTRWAWIMISLGLTVSVVWWYWTMKLVRIAIDSWLDELDILKDISDDIKSIKKDLLPPKK